MESGENRNQLQQAPTELHSVVPQALFRTSLARSSSKCLCGGDVFIQNSLEAVMTRLANLPLEEPPKKVSTLYVCSNVHSVEMFSSPKSSKAQPKSTNFI